MAIELATEEEHGLGPEDFVSVEVVAMEPLPVGANPFHYDAWSMGTPLVRGWIAMHDGYDREEEPRALQGLYLHNSRTGQRIRLKFNKAQ